MKLYIHPVSQHARRVLMLCHELGIEPEIRPVALDRGEHRAETFLALNPAGRVPVPVDGDTTLAESQANMRYLADRSGDCDLYPREHGDRARIDMWLDWNHTMLNPPVQTVAIETFTRGGDADRGIVAAARDSVDAALGVPARALEDGPFVRSGISLAHLSIASTLALYEMVGGDLSGAASVNEWYGAIKARPCFCETAPMAA